MAERFKQAVQGLHDHFEATTGLPGPNQTELAMKSNKMHMNKEVNAPQVRCMLHQPEGYTSATKP